MSRFEDVTEDVLNLVGYVRKEWFPELVNAKMKILFDLKKRSSGGKLVLGRMQKTNDLLRHLTTEESDSDEGYDYIMYLDKLIYNNIEEDDKIRLIRHECRHCFMNIEANNPYSIIGHDIEDFQEEIILNAENISWASRCATIGMSLYDQD